MSVAKKVIAEQTACVNLIKSYTRDNEPFFAFVLMRVCDAEQLSAGNPEDFVSLPENTIVLHWGKGHEISEDDRKIASAEFKKLLKNRQ